jgi:hypothetical protein
LDRFLVVSKKLAWYIVGYESEPEPEPHENDVAPKHSKNGTFFMIVNDVEEVQGKSKKLIYCSLCYF